STLSLHDALPISFLCRTRDEPKHSLSRVLREMPRRADRRIEVEFLRFARDERDLLGGLRGRLVRDERAARAEEATALADEDRRVGDGSRDDEIVTVLVLLSMRELASTGVERSCAFEAEGADDPFDLLDLLRHRVDFGDRERRKRERERDAGDARAAADVEK